MRRIVFARTMVAEGGHTYPEGGIGHTFGLVVLQYSISKEFS